MFTGSFNHDYEISQFRDPDNMAHYHSTGNQVVAANRLAYFFDFKGPSITLDTACSGSSNALHLACQAIKAGEADQALVSGCTLILDPDPMIGMNNLQYDTAFPLDLPVLIHLTGSSLPKGARSLSTPGVQATGEARE